MSQKIACWVGAQGQMKLVKNLKTPPLVMSLKTEKKISTKTRRLPESVKGLNTFLAAGDLWPKKRRPS